MRTQMARSGKRGVRSHARLFLLTPRACGDYIQQAVGEMCRSSRLRGGIKAASPYKCALPPRSIAALRRRAPHPSSLTALSQRKGKRSGERGEGSVRSPLPSTAAHRFIADERSCEKRTVVLRREKKKRRKIKGRPYRRLLARGASESTGVDRCEVQ